MRTPCMTHQAYKQIFPSLLHPKLWDNHGKNDSASPHMTAHEHAHTPVHTSHADDPTLKRGVAAHGKERPPAPTSRHPNLHNAHTWHSGCPGERSGV